MIDLTNAHVHEYPKANGVLTIRSADSGWLIGVVGEVKTVIDPMEKVSVSGTLANGTYANSYQFDVPLSICLKGALAIMEYITKNYPLKP